jgi:uncharacterized protein
VAFLGARAYITASLEKSMLRRPKALSASVDTRVPGLKVEDLTIAIDGDQIPARWVSPESGETKAAIFIAHGGQPEWLEEWFGVQRLLAERGIRSFVFDYVGFGKSVGSPTRAKLDRDLHGAWQVFEKGVGQERVALLGLSHGCAMLLKNQEIFGARPQNLILLSCYDSIREVLATTGRLGRPWNQVLVPDLYNNVKAARRLKLPLLQIHGGLDHLVKPAAARAIADAVPGDKRFLEIPDLGHNDAFTKLPPSVWDVVIEKVR